MIILRSLVFNLIFYLWPALISVFALPVLLVSQRATAWDSGLWRRWHCCCCD